VDSFYPVGYQLRVLFYLIHLLPFVPLKFATMSSPVRPQVSEIPLSSSEKSLPTHDEGSNSLPANPTAGTGHVHHTFTRHDENWDGGDVDFSNVDEKAVLRKMGLRLLPMLALLYLLSFLDRGNIGNAKIEGLTETLHMTGPQYNWCLTVFFFTYCAFEVPSNLMSVKFCSL
jgi:hypothetical protein